MIRDITLGQYYPIDSFIHKLDPRVKLVATFAYLVSLFIYKDLVGYIIATIVLAVMIKVSKVPFRFMTKGLRAIIMLLLITVIINVLFGHGEALVSFWKFRITETGLKTAGYMSVRLVYLIIGSSIMTLTTTPNQLTDGLEKLFQVFNKIGVPVHEIAMMMSIALRFIPILLEETDKIMKAQIARGADFESGNLISKAKSLIPLLVPLFVSAFRRANDLAMAMEARCYQGGVGRTKMKPLQYQKRDFIVYGIMTAYLIITFVERHYIHILSQ